MTHGGARKGSGRKPGGLNKLTREIAAAAAAEGITPLEVLVNSMRVAWDKSQTDPAYLSMAISCAEKAAPYMHARIASVQHNIGGQDGENPVKHRVIVEWSERKE